MRLYLVILLTRFNKLKLIRKVVDKMWYPIIKNYYFQGLYTEANLVIFVTANMITEEEMLQMIEEKKALEESK